MAEERLNVESHFGFHSSPFSASSGLHLLPHVLAASHAVLDALTNGARTILLHGAAGTGKTATLSHLAELLVRNGESVQLPAPEQVREGKCHHDVDYLLIDEAQSLSQDSLKQLVKARADSGIATILVAHDSSAAMLRPLVDHIVRLEGLSLKGADSYLREHILFAGGDPNLFTAQAVARLAQVADGSVWRLRSLAGTALVNAMFAGRQHVDPEDVQKELIPGGSDHMEDSARLPVNAAPVPAETAPEAAPPVVHANRRWSYWPVAAATVGVIAVAAGIFAFVNGSIDLPSRTDADSGSSAETPTSAGTVTSSPEEGVELGSIIPSDGPSEGMGENGGIPAESAAAASNEVQEAQSAIAAETGTDPTQSGRADEGKATANADTSARPENASSILSRLTLPQPDPPKPDPRKPAMSGARLSIFYVEDNDASAARASRLELALQARGWTVDTIKSVNFPVTAPTLRYYQAEQSANVDELRGWISSQLQGDLAKVTPGVVDFSKVAAAPDGTIEILIP